MPRCIPLPVTCTCAPSAWPRSRVRSDCSTLNPICSTGELSLRPNAGVDTGPGPGGVLGRIPPGPPCARASAQSAAPALPVSLRSIGLDGLAVPTLPTLALATQWLRGSPLPLLPAPTQPPVVGAPTPGALARALFPLCLHPPGPAAPPGLAEPQTALQSALRKCQRHTTALWPGTLRRRVGHYRHPSYLGPEPHEPSSPPLSG